MNALTIESLDYRYILINNYKYFKLSENELVILLIIDSLKKKTLITGDQLEVKMSISAKEIDEGIVSLMNKGFLSYETVDGILITSIEPTFKKILAYMSSKIINEDNEEELKKQEDALTKVMKTLEEEMKRSLTPLEIDLISNWFKEGVHENVINNAIDECILKGKKLTVKAIDRTITKNLQHTDRVEEGFTTVDEKTKRDIKKSMEIVSYDWVNSDEN